MSDVAISMKKANACSAEDGDAASVSVDDQPAANMSEKVDECE